MGGCRCSFRNCKSATKTNSDLHFFHYPVKHKERCHEWVRNARRPEFFNLPDDQLRNKVVCDLHFEKCYFTNALRKRLVHNAVPTLAAGCEDEILNEGTGEFPSIDILPANEDGTIFTLDTDSMQQKGDDPISTYSFKNGTLVPVYQEEESDQLIYTIDDADFKVVQNFRENNAENNYVFVNTNKEHDSAENYEIVFNGESQQPTVEKKSHSAPSMEITTKIYSKPEPKKTQTSSESMEIVYLAETPDVKPELVEMTNLPVVNSKPDVKESIKPESTVQKVYISKNSVKKKVLKQINNHSREIAYLKKALLQANLQKSCKINLNAFKGKVHPTFLGALTVNLYKKESNFSQNEANFLTTLYKTSPECYTLLKNQLHWDLPPPSVVEKLIDTKTTTKILL